ncbi:protein-lysine N-methyltransferase N6AMT2 [Pelomyxa schiedti]|nr:protein-lysine N-methyltransferase N6AMT2 [Pelomyxa schiedti]
MATSSPQQMATYVTPTALLTSADPHLLSNASASASDDLPELSPETAAVLQEFLNMRAQRAIDINSGGVDSVDSAIESVEEDWELSQFWYEEDTAQFLAQTAIKCSHGGRIACVSTPTLFRTLHKMNHPQHLNTLFEYDRRFSSYRNQFVFFDVNKPKAIPKNLHHKFSFVCADPPFLNPTIVANTIQTMALLAKSSSTPVLLLTGAVLEESITQITNGSLKRQPFTPRHSSGRLQNEFGSFANFTLTPMKG